MSWIESHQSLLTHRKTLRAAALLRIDRHKLIGHLHALWWWGLDNATNNGHLGSVLDEEIAEAAGWPVRRAEQFVSVLVEAGFLDRDGAKLGLHDWWEYAGKLNAKRAKDRARKAEVAGNSSGIPPEVAGKSQAPNQPTNQPLPSGSNQPDQPTDLLALLAHEHEDVIGTITPKSDGLLRDWAERVPDSEIGRASIRYAFMQAELKKKRYFGYVEGTLKRLEAEGWPRDMEGDHGAAKAQSRANGRGAKRAAEGPPVYGEIESWKRREAERVAEREAAEARVHAGDPAGKGG